MKITLVNPPISLEDVYGRFRKLASFQPPVGRASLAGYLLPNGHEVQIIDCNALGLKLHPFLAGVGTIWIGHELINHKRRLTFRLHWRP